MIGESVVMRELKRRAILIASSKVTAWIEGARGTGKSWLARFLHDNSPRRAGPFVVRSCSAIPADAICEEFFGFASGHGALDEAVDGTLVLDDVGSLPLPVQHQLTCWMRNWAMISDTSADIEAVRAQQEREQRGEAPPRWPNALPQDVRLIVLTERDLSPAVEEGDFRGDLFFRLRVAPLLVPQLRERREDIPLLARHFVEEHAVRQGKPELELGHEALQSLCDHPWPGNIGELESCIEEAAAVSRANTIEPEDLRLEPASLPLENQAISTRDSRPRCSLRRPPSVITVCPRSSDS